MTEPSAEPHWCPNCGAQTGLSYQIVEWLREAPTAIAIWDIYKAFPEHHPKAVRRALLTLKARGLVDSPQRGYYSA